MIVERHLTITLEVGHLICCAGAVDWKLLVVDTDAMTVGVGIGEETGLKNWIGRRFDSRDHVGRIVCHLLDLGEIVDGILVEDEFSNLTSWELLLRPDVREVEDVDLLLLPKLFGFLGRHGLNLQRPLGAVTVLDGEVEIFLGVVRSLAVRIFLRDEFCALLRFHVNLSVDPITMLVDKLECMTTVSMHEAVSIWDATIAHQDHELMDGFGVLRCIVPEDGAVIGMCEVGGRMSLLCMDEVREFGRITKEEDGCVVRHMIPIAFFCPELDGKASRITGTVVRAGLPTDGRETDGDWAFLAGLANEVGKADIVQRLCAGEDSVGSGTFGMYDTLRDTFTVEMGEEVDQVEVLEEERTICPGPLCLVWMWHRHTIAGGIEGILGLGVSIILIGFELVVRIHGVTHAALCC